MYDELIRGHASDIRQARNRYIRDYQEAERFRRVARRSQSYQVVNNQLVEKQRLAMQARSRGVLGSALHTVGERSSLKKLLGGLFSRILRRHSTIDPYGVLAEGHRQQAGPPDHFYSYMAVGELAARFGPNLYQTLSYIKSPSGMKRFMSLAEELGGDYQAAGRRITTEKLA